MHLLPRSISSITLGIALAVTAWFAGALSELQETSSFLLHDGWMLAAPILLGLGAWAATKRELRLRARVAVAEEAFAARSAELTEARRQLMDAQQQASASEKLKSRFMASMSHELRTPLNAIIGFAEILDGEMLGPLGRPEYREYSSDIRSSGYQLLRVVNDILDLSRAEAGCMELQIAPVNVDEAIQSVLAPLAAEAERNGIGLRVEVPKDLDPIPADEIRFCQVLTHLISNGIKFTSRGGQVTLLVRPEPGRLLISIADTGVGIPASCMQQALAPFGQVDGSLSREYQGSGLGLPLSRALVALHGGSLQLSSIEGRGTTVTLSFPQPGRGAPKIAV